MKEPSHLSTLESLSVNARPRCGANAGLGHVLCPQPVYKNAQTQNMRSSAFLLTLTPPQHVCPWLTRRSSSTGTMGQVDTETATIAYAFRTVLASSHRRTKHNLQRHGCHWEWKDHCRLLRLIIRFSSATLSFRLLTSWLCSSSTSSRAPA